MTFLHGTKSPSIDHRYEIDLELLSGKLHLAPLGNPSQILDIGTGTGIWVTEIESLYPNAHIIGTALNLVQPMFTPILPNVRFDTGDAEKNWVYKDILYIHMRNLAECIKSWDQVISSAYRCTAPGGVVELWEMEMIGVSDDGIVGEAFSKWLGLLKDGLATVGCETTTWELIQESRRKLSW
ncbi:hypothetical protein FPQ18DRAFT_305889 [Pyronema domesticum]|nr:hypothetical protein FPQ18DRAFT_305889 [Pyronema domesticum]